MHADVFLSRVPPPNTNATVAVILREYKIMHADVFLKCDATEDQLIDIMHADVFLKCDATEDQLIDVIEGN
ncbi:hypothetical protein T484DRAFT_1795579, partial [Baffinella frigidus]